MYTDRLPLSAFQELSLLKPVWRGKRRGGMCTFANGSLCSTEVVRYNVCVWLHVCIFPIIAHKIQKVDEKRRK